MTTGQWPTLWKSIFEFLKNSSASEIHIDCLSAIRILSRDKSILNDSITTEQFDVLLNLGNIGSNNVNCSSAISIEALKCMCNLVFNSTKVQDMCLKNDAVEGIIKRIRSYK